MSKHIRNESVETLVKQAAWHLAHKGDYLKPLMGFSPKWTRRESVDFLKSLDGDVRDVALYGLAQHIYDVMHIAQVSPEAPVESGVDNPHPSTGAMPWMKSFFKSIGDFTLSVDYFQHVLQDSMNDLIEGDAISKSMDRRREDLVDELCGAIVTKSFGNSSIADLEAEFNDVKENKVYTPHFVPTRWMKKFVPETLYKSLNEHPGVSVQVMDSVLGYCLRKSQDGQMFKSLTKKHLGKPFEISAGNYADAIELHRAHMFAKGVWGDRTGRLDGINLHTFAAYGVLEKATRSKEAFEELPLELRTKMNLAAYKKPDENAAAQK